MELSRTDLETAEVALIILAAGTPDDQLREVIVNARNAIKGIVDEYPKATTFEVIPEF